MNSTPYQNIVTAFNDALEFIGAAGVDPEIRLTPDAKFGDYQSNVAMGLAKKLGRKPRELAQQIVNFVEARRAVPAIKIIHKLEIAGPGFINIFLSDNYLAQQLSLISNDLRLGIAEAQKKISHVVDFSSPNLAKEMHVGHLRTTITGEVISRVIEFMGHPVERINHIGDWGTQFGMLLQYIHDDLPEVVSAPENFHVSDLQLFYQKAKARFDSDPNFALAARGKVVLLQSGDPQALKLWRAILAESLKHCHAIYKDLGVTLKDQGESFYNNRLQAVVEELKVKGVATEERGAICVFLDGFVGRENEPLPFIVQKSDGGYNYATTDLAAIKYRLAECHAKRLIYVTDTRQTTHFAMLFATARKAGWVADDVELHHIGYGMVLGDDHKPFKTRDGSTVHLKNLIAEAIQRADDSIVKKRAGLDPEKRQNIARTVGLAAIKYCDLSHNLASDYVFGWDKMLGMEGNTGPYMLYVYARIASIGRKAGLDLMQWVPAQKITLGHSSERSLALVLSRFCDVVNHVFTTLKPNFLTEYLYDLSHAFNIFYDKNLGVPVLEAATPELKNSRLALCALTAKTLKLGLNLLSIDVVDEM